MLKDISPKFDFSKEDDQKRFEKLPEEQKTGIIKESETEVGSEEEIKKFIDILFLEHPHDGEEFVIEGEGKRLSLPRLVRSSQMAQEMAKQALVKAVSDGNISLAREIKEQFFLSKAELSFPEFQEAAKNRFAKHLLNGEIEDAFRIKSELLLPDSVTDPITFSSKAQDVGRNIFVAYLLTGDPRALTIKEKLSFSDSVISSPEVKVAAIKGLPLCLENNNFDTALEIINKFHFSESETQQAVGQGFKQCIIDRNYSVLPEYKKKFSLSDAAMLNTAKEGFLECLDNGQISDAIEIKENFPLTVSSKEIIAHLKWPDAFLAALQEKIPKLYDQIMKLPDTTLEIQEVYGNNLIGFLKITEKAPFLVNAIIENPRFGSKLLVKFPQLDELSQRNIYFLLNAKKEIASANPRIDPESHEFRQLMQEKLKEYRNNPAMLEAIKKGGININEWLNYGEESAFDLGEEEDIALSEKLKTPVFRIRESLESYSNSLKNILAEYKKEFSGMMVTEDLEEVKLQIEKLTQEKEKALAENNTKKADGIDKGLAQLQKRIVNPKSIPLWEKVLGDLSLVDRVTKDVLSAYTTLIETEASLQNYPKDQSRSTRERREEVLKLKHKAENAKQEFVGKFKTLEARVIGKSKTPETRVISFKERLNKTLTSAIGEERANKIIGDWETAIAEGMTHFESDKTTVANIFEHEDGEQGKLDRTPMAVRVWARNPDVDLYLGNYTDCCIRIDSEHMGEESTIADYLTDVGMQVVTVYDEKKKIPVVAAWTFIGVNENGETALVVDNIETNTDYGTNYRTQLEAKLKTYFTEYTKSAGLKKFVQGQSNNDLVIAEMDGKYVKLGGYNREDGYFLEGEHGEDDEEEGENDDEN